MGCPLSKNGNENDSNNAAAATGGGGTASANSAPAKVAESGKNGDGGGASAKPADPRLPLNVRQKFNLSKSWKGISREMEMTGVLMFVK